MVTQFFKKLPTTVMLYWAQKNQRERRFLILAGLLILLFCIYSFLLTPALDGRYRLQKDLPVLRQQAAELRALTARVLTLSGQLAIQPMIALDKEAIELSLKSKNLPAQSVVRNGDTAKVQLSGIAFAGLFDWLVEIQKNARWQVVDANINVVEGTTPGIVNATIILWQKKHE